jgi:hypothetical protein
LERLSITAELLPGGWLSALRSSKYLRDQLENSKKQYKNAM